MTQRITTFILALLLTVTTQAQTSHSETAASTTFTSSPITPDVEARITGKSYPAECSQLLPISELRYLRISHWNAEGKSVVGEMICNRAIAKSLLAIFRTLYEAHYPIERMELVDEYGADDERSMQANNTSCFNFRFINGTRTISLHGRGMAVDINPLYNPCVHRNGKIEPSTGAPYAYNRLSIPKSSPAYPYIITGSDHIVCRTFRAHGFTWGGSWRNKKDYQHFEHK